MKLESFYLFSRLSGDQIAQLEALATVRRYEAGSVLFMAGQMPRHLLLLKKGRVRVYRHDDRGTEVTLHHFGPGDLIAEMAALEKMPYPASAVCESGAELVVIALAPFERILADSPALSGSIIRSLCHKIRHLEQAFRRTAGGGATARVAALLCDSTHLFDSMRQHEIASMLGMTPETLSRTLKKLRHQGLIEPTPKGFRICDRAQLEALAPQQ